MITLDHGGAGAATTRIVSPPRRLEQRVECLWMERPSVAGVSMDELWRIVPDHCGHLLYHRMADRTRLTLVGPRTSPVDVRKGRRQLGIGVRVRPWALPALFGVAPSELRDRSVPLSDLLAREARELKERLDASSQDECMGTILKWLEGRAMSDEAASERRARASSLLLSHSGSCGDAAARLGMSSRALRTLMGSHVGLPPKTYARIVRLHRALERVGSGEPWSTIALASGYYDQAHMIREFQSLLGESPEVWKGRGACPAEGSVHG